MSASEPHPHRGARTDGPTGGAAPEKRQEKRNPSQTIIRSTYRYSSVNIHIGGSYAMTSTTPGKAYIQKFKLSEFYEAKAPTFAFTIRALALRTVIK